MSDVRYSGGVTSPLPSDDEADGFPTTAQLSEEVCMVFLLLMMHVR